jgi:hypothetical protein
MSDVSATDFVCDTTVVRAVGTKVTLFLNHHDDAVA